MIMKHILHSLVLLVFVLSATLLGAEPDTHDGPLHHPQVPSVSDKNRLATDMAAEMAAKSVQAEEQGVAHSHSDAVASGLVPESKIQSHCLGIYSCSFTNALAFVFSHPDPVVFYQPANWFLARSDEFLSLTRPVDVPPPRYS
ncbi:hypothetical protein O4H49_02735 [Kiloniella laminariae]|uniref:Uncharacterized protein n=1 Tax=Kiloniella laminariae TaxID=454162 RepID=A0ABT4LF06_9PROT|nr:hypothetical protein [Kiloniella laminariae]MCZ4279678.1 hypothetical protein [Kiloniella laminariae]